MNPDAKTIKEYVKVLREEKEIAKRQVKLSYKGQHYESPQNSDLRLAAISFALDAVESILENDKRNVARGEEKLAETKNAINNAINRGIADRSFFKK